MNSIETLKELREIVEGLDTDAMDECLHHPEYCDGQTDTIHDVVYAIDEMIERLVLELSLKILPL